MTPLQPSSPCVPLICTLVYPCSYSLYTPESRKNARKGHENLNIQVRRHLQTGLASNLDIDGTVLVSILLSTPGYLRGIY